MRVISLLETVQAFNLAITARANNLVIALFNSNTLLQDYFYNKDVTCGSTTLPIDRISPQGLIITSKCLLEIGCFTILKKLWDKNSLLTLWYSGNAVNFNPPTKLPDLHFISYEDSITCFKIAMYAKLEYILLISWHANRLIPAWYKGEEINFGGTIEPDLRIISLNETLSIFNAAIGHQLDNFIPVLWNTSSKLQQWYSCKVINIGSSTEPQLGRVSFDELVIVMTTLDLKFQDILKTIASEHFTATGDPALQNIFNLRKELANQHNPANIPSTNPANANLSYTAARPITFFGSAVTQQNIQTPIAATAVETTPIPKTR